MNVDGNFAQTGCWQNESPYLKTDALRTEYSENGYVLAKNAFDAKDLLALQRGLRSVLAKTEACESDHACLLEELILRRESQDHSQVYKAAQSVGSRAATYKLLGSSQILETVSQITGFDPSSLHLLPLYLIIQLPSDERFDYTWHQDGSYYPWCENFLTLWFPVNRATGRDTGTISLIPGSHRYGPREADTFFRHGYFRQIEAKLQTEETDREEMLEADLGDCCIMNGNTVHRSVANRSSSPRVAGVLRIASLAPHQSYERERFYCTHKS